MATLTVTAIDRTGIQVSLAAADVGGDEFANTGREFLVIDNASGVPVTVTAVTQKTIDGEAVADKSISVDAGQREYFGPFPTGTYNDGNDRVQITYSAVASVTVNPYQLTNV